jgi:hypothetical protein
MTLTELDTLLDHLKKLPMPQKQEANLFSVGARGHYENPVSDVLAFYLDPDGDHGLNTLALDALLTCLPQTEGLATALVMPSAREVITDSGNFIDILLEADDWIMAIENKVWHKQNNPFSDYVAYLEHEDYQGKTKYCVVLSPKGGAPEGWISVSYRQLTQALSSRLAEAFVASPLNKWLVFLREYVLHLESLMSLQPVESKTEKFVLTNLHSIAKLAELKKTVIKSMLEEGKRYLTEYFSAQSYKVCARLGEWDGYPILRFSLAHWMSKSDVVLHLNGEPDEWFEVRCYASELTSEALREKAITILNVEGCNDEHYDDENTPAIGFYTYHDPITTEKVVLWQDVARRLELLERFEYEAR